MEKKIEKRKEKRGKRKGGLSLVTRHLSLVTAFFLFLLTGTNEIHYSWSVVFVKDPGPEDQVFKNRI
jgi:hypothetical protein